MRYVIIGNSTAAVACIEAIRQKDEKGSITVISSEPHHVYSRPLISYLLLGKTDRQKMKYRPDGFYKDHFVTVLYGRTAEKIDSDEKKVHLENGETVDYDKLLVATGSRPFVPPIKGLDTVKNVHTFMSLDDALALEQAIGPDSRVLILGAGLIGLKCAEGIAGKVAALHVVDMAGRILPSILDDAGAAMVQRHIEQSANVTFHLSQSIERLEANAAHLTGGDALKFDALVIAVGVRANVNLVKEAGGEVNQGILIDTTCRTSLPDVYAAGDCTEGYDSTIGSNRVLALLPNAYRQGETAGLNMAGEKARYDCAIPMNAIGFFGLHMITAGGYEGECYAACEDGDGYKKLFYKGDRLLGYIMIGDVAKAGIYTALIRERTPLSSIDFELICQQPSLMAFSRAERKVMLGGTAV
ncbi:MAG: NAD(P)/FAD-dependent oxidoreductase [Christensenellales bacterium]|jgi:NAD(P)H-nitrite reductase large subunit